MGFISAFAFVIVLGAALLFGTATIGPFWTVSLALLLCGIAIVVRLNRISEQLARDSRRR